MLEMAQGAAFYFKPEVEFEPAAVEKFLTADKKPVLESVLRHLDLVNEWNEGTIEAAFGAVMEETGLKLGKIGPSVRVALVGGTTSPGIFDVLAVLGKEASLKRLQIALDRL